MIAAAVIGLVIVVGIALGVIVWSVKRGDRYVDDLLVAKDRSVVQTLRAERAEFEREKTETALISERTRAEALTDFVSHYAGETNETGDLDPDDVDGRVLRIARWWGEANAAGDQIRPGAARVVRDPAAPRASTADVHAGTGRDDTALMRPED